jgi:hypothetical protein
MKRLDSQTDMIDVDDMAMEPLIAELMLSLLAGTVSMNSDSLGVLPHRNITSKSNDVALHCHEIITGTLLYVSKREGK